MPIRNGPPTRKGRNLARDRFEWNKEPPREYRWRCGLRAGLWYPTYTAAGNAAVKQGLASWYGEHLCTGPLVEIESREVSRRRRAA